MQNLKINGVPTPYWCRVLDADAIDLYIYKGVKRDSLCYSHGLLGSSWTELNLPLGNWELLGCITLSSMDEVVKGMVEGIEEYKGIWIWKDYVTGKALHTAHESALSLLQHNQITLTADTKAVVVKQKI